MTVIVKGHGADTDGEDTFVPAGVTVRFYTAENVDLDTDVALLALLDAAGDPGVPISGNNPIKNYTLYKQDDQFIAQWYTLAGDSGTNIKWVGTDIPDQTRLCEDPDRHTSDTLTCRAVGEHNCNGVLGLLKGETDIAIVACRGSWVPGAKKGGKTATSYDEPISNIDAWLADTKLQLEAGKVAEVETAVDDLPPEAIALAIVTTWFADWQRARWLKEYALQSDLTQFFGQLTSNKEKLGGMMNWVGKISSYGQAVDDLATSNPGAFFQHFEQADGSVQSALKGRDTISRLVESQQQLAERIEEAGIEGWHPTDSDYDEISRINGENVKEADDGDALPIHVGGVVMLIGAGHEATRVNYVQRQQDYEQGTVTVKKAGPFSKGTLATKGISAKKDLVTTLVAEFSDKKVVFG